MGNINSTRKKVRGRAKRAKINAQHIFDELEGINILYKEDKSKTRSAILVMVEYSILLRDMLENLYKTL